MRVWVSIFVVAMTGCGGRVASRDVAVASEGRAASTSTAEGAEAFGRLRGLVGDWEAKTASGKTVKASYRLVSADSALVETFTTASGKETLTVFHMDGAALMATHYCAQGNQPRLRMTQATPSGPTVLELFDVTNLKRAGDSHLRKLVIEMKDATHFAKTEDYLENGKDEVTVLSFVRKEASPG